MKDRLTMEEKLAAYIEGTLSEEEKSIIEEQLKGTEQKKGIFERLFFTLHIKLPIQVFAVIFLAAVSIFIYKSYKPEPDSIQSTQPGIPTDQPQTEEVWGDIRIIVNVKDIDNANNAVQTAITNLGGIVLRKQSFKSKNILSVLLDLKQVNELYERLKPIGEVKEEGDLSTVKGNVKVKIEIVNK